MKKILLIPIVGLLVSCGEAMSPNFSDKTKPFIVTEIVSLTDGICKYFAISEGTIIDCFYADEKIFNIGDTVKVCK